jgi:hypothetical protein
MDIVELYVIIDDFCQKFMPKYINLLKHKGLATRSREGMLNISETILIILLFTQSGYKYFKWFYINELAIEYKDYFKQLPSYNRFVEIMPRSLPILFRLLNYLMYHARLSGFNIEYVDSTKIPVCHNKRTNSHKLFSGIAKIGKSTMGWFFGFKLHITCDTLGNLTSMAFSSGNTDDRVPVLKLLKGFTGKVFADKGYISSKLAEQLQHIGVTLITTPKKNMKSRFMPVNFFDVILHKKRSIIESVINILKGKLQLCHTRHRSLYNFIVHIVSVLIGYQLLCNKPKIRLENFMLNQFA